MSTPWPIGLLGLPGLDPLPQPAPTALLWGLLLLTFFLHLMSMNLVLGGSIVALAARVRHGSPGSRRHLEALVSRFAHALPVLVSATVSFGVAALLFLQAIHGRAFFASAILMAWPWLAVVPTVILAYYGTYRLAFTTGRHAARDAWLASAVTIAFTGIAFVYVSNMSMMLRADRFAEWTAIGTSGWHLNLDDPTLWPRFLHLLLGAVAVAGVGTGVLGLRKRRHDAAFAVWAMQHGAGWAAAATILNLLIGFWWLLALPRDVLLRFMGRDPAAAIALLAGIVCGMVAIGLFGLAWRAADPAPAVKAGAGAMTATLLAMVVTRDQVRESAFVLMGMQPASWVEPQWGPALIFALLFAGALMTVIWMARLLALSRGTEPPS